MCTDDRFSVEPRIFNWDAVCSAFSELFYGQDEDSLVDPSNYKLVVDTFANNHLVGDWLIDACKNIDANITLLSNLTYDPEINSKSVEYLKLVKELNDLSENNVGVIFMVHSDDLDEYLNDKFSQNEEINAIADFVDWKGLALRERDSYGKIELTYPMIGYDGQWLYR